MGYVSKNTSVELKIFILWDAEDHLAHFIRQKHLWRENHRF